MYTSNGENCQKKERTSLQIRNGTETHKASLYYSKFIFFEMSINLLKYLRLLVHIKKVLCSSI